MIFTMLVSLYTSRVILERLGVDDYGIYQAVGGIVAFLSFLNGALSNSTSRFLTFELGAGNTDRLKKTFSTLLSSHIILALIVVILGETIGLWYFHNKMVIPPDRMGAAVFVFHLSIITAFLNLTQVPYSAAIIAHEKMSIYAYTSIVEVLAKLSICYLLGVGGYDKLKMYAILLFVVQSSLIIYYRCYCNHKFEETKYKFILDKDIMKPVLSFSGWSLFGWTANAFTDQGVLLLLNLFFSPAVVAARAISLQVNNAANQLVRNFRTAANPQIIKLFAEKDYNSSKKLLLQSTKFSYYLMFVIALPVVFLAEPLLHLWLGDNVPEFTTIFLQLAIIQSLVQVFDTSFFTALYAKGQLKENALISPFVCFVGFPLVYYLFKAGYSPVALSWVYILVYSVLSFIVKPILTIRIVNYCWQDMFSVFAPCLGVSIAAVIPAFLIDYFMNSMNIIQFILEAILLILIALFTSYTVGLNKGMRRKLNGVILNKLSIKKK